MTEEIKVGTRALTLMESFKLMVWTMWKGGIFSDTSTAKLLGFMDRLGTKETIDFCMGELKELINKEPEAYAGTFNDSIFGASNEQGVEGSGESGGESVRGSEASQD